MVRKIISFWILSLTIIPKMESIDIGIVRKPSCTSKRLLSFPFTEPKYENIDLTGLVIVTSWCKTDTCDLIFGDDKVTCFGFLIHPKIVLTLSKCVPQSQFADYVRIRSYTWSQHNNEIDGKTIYKALNVSQIIENPHNIVGSPERKFNNLAAVILLSPLNIQPLFQLANNNFNSSYCFIIDSDDHIASTDGLSLDQFRPFIFETSESGFEKCFIKNKTDLFIGNTFCAFIPSSFVCGGNIGNPYICRSSVNANHHLLQGILIDRNGQYSAYLGTNNIAHWIQNIVSSLDAKSSSN